MQNDLSDYWVIAGVRNVKLSHCSPQKSKTSVHELCHFKWYNVDLNNKHKQLHRVLKKWVTRQLDQTNGTPSSSSWPQITLQRSPTLLN